ncbi:tail fiber [Escherichia phage Es2]|nr:tail fiber [Escherichia phage Es2]
MVTKTVIPTDITKLKNESLNKNNNLSDLADRAAAWLNVRPIGSTPLAGDPVGDYDAATKRWVENKINTGTVGPTMNGVMNYGVGDFHLRDSRAYIQPYEVVSDGQLLNRADWPELWAYAQMVGLIEDSVWLADKFQRGKYSSGDGTTTFRVPDRNGVQQGSIRALYGRGDGGMSDANGRAFESAAPNITGAVPSYSGGMYAQVFGSAARGAFFSDNMLFPNGDGDVIPAGKTPLTGRCNTLNFDASRSSPIYGASNDEILTRNFVGVWVIRASGGFVAANTSWSVINGDATRPIDGTRVESGKVSVEYKIGTAIEAQGNVYTAATMGGAYSTQLSVKNATTGKEKDISVTEDGDLWSDRFKARFGTRMAWAQTGWAYGTFSQANQSIGNDYNFYSILSGSQSSSTGYKTHTHIGQIHNDNGSFADSCWHVAGDDDNKYGVRLKIQPNNNSIYFYSWWPGASAVYTLQLNAVSDSRLKHDIKAIDATKSIEVLKGLEFQSFVYNNDEKSRVRRGVIAQQVETIEPLYVKTRRFYNNDGVEQEQKELDTTPMLLDTMHVVQELIKRIESLEEELKQLKVQLVQ